MRVVLCQTTTSQLLLSLVREHAHEQLTFWLSLFWREGARGRERTQCLFLFCVFIVKRHRVCRLAAREGPSGPRAEPRICSTRRPADRERVRERVPGGQRARELFAIGTRIGSTARRSRDSVHCEPFKPTRCRHRHRRRRRRRHRSLSSLLRTCGMLFWNWRKSNNKCEKHKTLRLINQNKPKNPTKK